MRLQHTLRGTNPAAITPILTGLTYLAAHLHSQSGTTADLISLIDAALTIDIQPCADKNPCLRTALHAFLLNLISADAAYVEPVINKFAARVFLTSVQHRARLEPVVYDILHVVLDTHPAAASLLSRIIRMRYPHPIRAAEEHVAYINAILHVARACHSPSVTRSVIATIFEKLGAIEALVPSDVTDCEGAMLRPEAEKMQLVLMELIRHVDIVYKEDAEYLRSCFEPFFAAYESYIVPIESTRFTPYVMIYAAEKGGEALVHDLSERLRQSFFDPSMSHRLREKFLEHSSVVIMRSASVSSASALAWLKQLASWLNAYVDDVSRNGGGEVDTDVHRLFYSGSASLMTTCCRRRDAVASNANVIPQMRLYRIVGSAMKPMLVVPRGVVDDFVKVVADCCGMDFNEIEDQNEGRFRPSRTRYGSRNEFFYKLRCPDLELSLAADMLEGRIRWDQKRVLKVQTHPSDIGLTTTTL